MDIDFVYLPGDGIGPEVGAAALRVLDAVAARFDHAVGAEAHDFGGVAIDHHGTPLPDATLRACRDHGVMLLGAVGGPQWDHLSGEARPELGGLLKLRKAMNLYANLRPAKVLPELAHLSPLKPEYLQGVDILVVRELTGGIYFGEKTREDGFATDLMAYSSDEVEAIAHVAFKAAQGRRGKVTSVDKQNVLECSRLWRETVEAVAPHYPDVELEHLLVDACAMHLLSRPSQFDVILTANLFGDILTDEASMLVGSMGVIPSASLSDGTTGLYEPIHGSAPDIAGQDRANPVAMILSAAMMLRMSFGLEAEARAVEDAVAATLAAGETTGDLGGSLGTRAVGEAVAGRVG